MEKEKESEAFSKAWQFGLAGAQIALTTALVNSGAVKAEDVIQQINGLVNKSIEMHPEDVGFPEPLILIRDALLAIYPEGDKSINSMDNWLTDFIGNA